MAEQLVSALGGAGSPLTNNAAEAVLATAALPFISSGSRRIVRFTGLVRTTAQNGTDTLVVRARIGGLSGTALATTTAVDQVVGDVAIVRGEIVLRPDGAAAYVAHGTDADASGSLSPKTFGGVIASGLGQAPELVLTGQWSNANAGNSCQAELFDVHEEQF